ncbi:MAG: hypothetical protein ACI8UO_006241 [Verrucomicrobiales bacterium]|jgi:hypothetical protein
MKSAATSILLAGAFALGSAKGELFESRPGPWGQLEFYETVLEPPMDMLWMGIFDEEILWEFTESTPEQIQQLLVKFGIEQTWIEALKARAHWHPGERGMTVVPPHDLVLTLKGEQRDKLYRHIWWTDLGKRSYPIEAGEFRALDRRPISEDLIRFVESRRLEVDGQWHFCEVPILMRRLQNAEDKVSFVRALARTRGLIVRLRIDDNTNLDEVSDYWGTGKLRGDVNTILQGVRRAPGVNSVDIVNLLPPTPRKLINTYPQKEETIRYQMPHCFWTAFNFFNSEPRRRLLDFIDVQYHLDRGYEPTHEPPRIGDVLVWFEKETDKPNHSCVYIADDIVFTKNGISQLHPWLLMREADMLSRYPIEQLYRKVYRLKSEPSDS